MLTAPHAPSTFKRMKTAIRLGLSLRTVNVRDYIRYQCIKLRPELSSELQSFRGSLNHGMSDTSIYAYASWLRRWFIYLREEKPTTAAAERFLTCIEEQGYAALSIYCYRRAILKYFKLKGMSVELRCPKIFLNRTKSFSSDHLGMIIDGKLKQIFAPEKRVRPDHCELCGKQQTSHGRALRLNYHHWDDDDLSKGLWLCYRCHTFAEAADDGATTEQYLELKQRITRCGA